MQDPQAAMQPFIKLVQSNMELLSKYSMTPEAMAQAMSNAQAMFQQGQGAAANAAQSPQFGQLMQGMLKNYTEFLAEVGQNGMAMLGQAQQAMVERSQQAGESVTQATSGRSKRS